jgi:hypothetical protein
MLPNMKPADELAQIRAEMRVLRDREADLRIQFLAHRAPLDGHLHRVEIAEQQHDVFLRERLPERILSNPNYWDARTQKIVRIRPQPDAHKEDFDVIEQF